MASNQRPQPIPDTSIARIPKERLSLGVRSPFDRDCKFRAFRSLTGRALELCLNVIDGRDQSFAITIATSIARSGALRHKVQQAASCNRQTLELQQQTKSPKFLIAM